MASSQLNSTLSTTQFYEWNGYQCAYDVQQTGDHSSAPPLLLIHPIGVGLSRWFWYPFAKTWAQNTYPHTLYNPDLLGCGESDMPRVAYYPDDWARQLLHFTKTVIQQPVVLVSQGALFPVALQMLEQTKNDQEKGDPWIRGMVLSGPPGWSLITQHVAPRSKKLLWNLLFDSPFGNLFYRYARRQAFLDSFSKRQLFAREHEAEYPIDGTWLDNLQDDAQTMATRHAVFSFLAGFWRVDYTQRIESVQQPTLVLFGDEASGIDRVSKAESSQQRLDDYLKHLPNAQGKLIPGRNVLPYESTSNFVEETAHWLSSVF